MIIVRSPLRISLGGGGTDLPSFYKEHEGFLIAAAINKYVYISLHKTVVDYLILKYSEMEKVHSVDEIRHPIIRESMNLLNIKDINLEITSMADIPAGTGLGSSSSFTCALLKALHSHKKELIHPRELAEEACHVEIDLLKEPIGKQDQYASAFGGINTFKFCKDGNVIANPLKLSEETVNNLEDNLLLFFTGYSRSASSILKEQDDKSKRGDISMTENLKFVKTLGIKSQRAFESGNLEEFAEIMNDHWAFKRNRSGHMTNSKIDTIYDTAINNGALGGKLVGAGGGGFLMFYTNENQRLRHAMAKEGLKEIRFGFDWDGTKVIT